MCDKFERSQHQSNTQPTDNNPPWIKPASQRPTEPTDPVDLWGSNVQCNCLVAVKNGPAINMRFQLNLRPATHDAHFWTLPVVFACHIIKFNNCIRRNNKRISVAMVWQTDDGVKLNSVSIVTFCTVSVFVYFCICCVCYALAMIREQMLALNNLF